MPSQGKTVLLVDDEPTVREWVCRVLQAEGYHVLTSPNNPEAVEIAASRSLDLILLDLNTPEGWKTFHRLTEAGPLVPIIIITPRSNQLLAALNAGAAALMEKPLDFPALLSTMEQLISEPLAHRQARLARKGSISLQAASGLS